ncbi:helix-turn-helix domain-containing protein [Streptomyces scopuliridis]|uniref:helix-turn-helix domain-containing protein n=1 Tax=Streptomyces scopuliridis TaxID=452529 RepID=UPI002DDBB658|nr:helix-turn-helix domain-containing protein [Streptomyces scopuliridis]WSB37334.1 helix-turn-helix domain-containing protein [Streptomyces scopuliridis]
MHGESLAHMIRRLRTAKRWSQQRLAVEICRAVGVPVDSFTRGDIYRYERGKRTPRDWLPALALALGVPLEEFEAALATQSVAPQTVDDFLPEGEPLAPLRTKQGGRLGMGDVEGLAGRIHGLCLADDVLAGGDLIGPALRELRSAVKLYREGSHTEEIGNALLSQIGELAQIAGFIAADAGRRDEAQRIYQLGLSAAKQADAETLVGNLAGSLAYMWSNNGEAAKAVQLATAGLADGAPPKARALTLDRLAWAHTQAHEPQPAMRALAQAREALDQSDGEESPPYLYWVSHDELTVMESRVYTELHKPLRAVPILQKVLSRYDVTRTRELALYSSWLAIAYADANEPEESAATAARVISMSGDIASERITDRIQTVVERLQEFAEVPEVREVLEAVA